MDHDDVRSALARGAVPIDLRPLAEFSACHVAGAVYVKFARRTLVQTLAAAVEADANLVLISADGVVMDAASDLIQASGKWDVRGTIVLDGSALTRLGVPLGSLKQLTPEDLANRLEAGNPETEIIDVRGPFEWRLGYIPGSLLIPLGQLRQRTSEVKRNCDVVLICEEGNRSATAASMFVRRGYTRVMNLVGGVGQWFQQKRPLVQWKGDIRKPV